METAQYEEGPKYQSDTAKNYSAGAPNLTHEEQAEIFGWGRGRPQTLEQFLQGWDKKVRSLGLKGKKGLVLKFYDFMDYTGIYPREKLLKGKIKAVDKVAGELEEAMEQCYTSADAAYTKTDSNTHMKFKSGMCVEWCDGLKKKLEDEQKALKQRGREIRRKIKAGDSDPQLQGEYNWVREELYKIRKDRRKILRDRNQAALYVLKSKQKSGVYLADEIMKDKALEGLEAKYNEVELRRTELEIVGEVGNTQSLIGVMTLINKAEGVLSQTDHIAKDYREMLPEVVKRLQGENIGGSSRETIDANELKELAKEGESKVYLDALAAMEEDEEAELGEDGQAEAA
jgi:hypothetical protein